MNEQCVPMAMENTKQFGPRPISIVDRVEVQLQQAREKVADLEKAKELLEKYPDIADLLKYLRSI